MASLARLFGRRLAFWGCLTVWLSGNLAWGAQPPADSAAADSSTGVFAISYLLVLLVVCAAMLIVLQLSRLRRTTDPRPSPRALGLALGPRLSPGRLAQEFRRGDGSRAVGGEEFPEALDDDPLLRGGQLGEDGQGQHFVGRPLGFRQIVGGVAQLAVALLLVDAQRIINFAADLGLGQILAQRSRAGRRARGPRTGSTRAAAAGRTAGNPSTRSSPAAVQSSV